MIGDRREEIIDYTLDMLGNRLVQLASDDASKDEIAASFARFSERVDRNEVSPEEIETIAANVLNLSARGALITPEDAQLMLLENGESLPNPATEEASPSGPSKPDNETAKHVYQITTSSGTERPLNMKVFTSQLETMFKVADAARAQSDSMASHVHFTVGEQGVHVVMDSKAGDWVSRPEVVALTGELTDKQLVKWNETLARQQAERNKWLAEQAVRISRMEEALATGQTESNREMTGVDESRLLRAKQIQRLGSMGAIVRLDTTELKLELERVMEDLVLEFGDVLSESAVSIIVEQGISVSGPNMTTSGSVKGNQ